MKNPSVVIHPSVRLSSSVRPYPRFTLTPFSGLCCVDQKERGEGGGKGGGKGGGRGGLYSNDDYIQMRQTFPQKIKRCQRGDSQPITKRTIPLNMYTNIFDIKRRSRHLSIWTPTIRDVLIRLQKRNLRGVEQ